jgi:CDP-diacylglycerol--serine O-phosphatidyltransferase
LLAFGVATAFLTTAPWPTLMVVGVVYLSSIPLTVRSYYRLKRTAEARKPEPAERPDIVPLPGPATPRLDEVTPTTTEWRH